MSVSSIVLFHSLFTWHKKWLCNAHVSFHLLNQSCIAFIFQLFRRIINFLNNIQNRAKVKIEMLIE